MMLGIGQYALLSSYAQTREIPVSVQKAIGHLLVHSTKTFTFTPAVKDALQFIDWLSANREVTVTLDDDLYKQISLASSLCVKPALESYRRGSGRRSKVPAYYRDGYFLASLLGGGYVVNWVRQHEKYREYKSLSSNGSVAS